MKRTLFSNIILLTTITLAAFASLNANAQNARDLIRLGNREYRAGQYDKAETYYRKSIAKTPTFEAYYNLGNTLIMQQKDSTAYDSYAKADSLGTPDPMRRARCQHNMGNIWYAQGLAATTQEGGNAGQAFQNAVNHYKSSLRCNPKDDETRYNLAMAQFMLKKNQNNQNNGGGQDDKNEEKQDQDKQNQQDKQQQQKQQEEKEQQQKDDMSDQTAEQLLQSAQQDEKDVQRKVQQNPTNRRKSLEKDW